MTKRGQLFILRLPTEATIYVIQLQNTIITTLSSVFQVLAVLTVACDMSFTVSPTSVACFLYLLYWQHQLKF